MVEGDLIPWVCGKARPGVVSADLCGFWEANSVIRGSARHPQSILCLSPTLFSTLPSSKSASRQLSIVQVSPLSHLPLVKVSEPEECISAPQHTHIHKLSEVFRCKVWRVLLAREAPAKLDGHIPVVSEDAYRPGEGSGWFFLQAIPSPLRGTCGVSPGPRAHIFLPVSGSPPFSLLKVFLLTLPMWCL